MLTTEFDLTGLMPDVSGALRRVGERANRYDSDVLAGVARGGYGVVTGELVGCYGYEVSGDTLEIMNEAEHAPHVDARLGIAVFPSVEGGHVERWLDEELK